MYYSTEANGSTVRGVGKGLPYLGLPSVLEIEVMSMNPPSAWQTQVSPLPEAGGH